MPIFTVVNKCDRVGEDPLKLIGDVESDLELDCHPVTWPIHSDGAFIGVYDRRRRLIYRFERGEDHGASRAEVNVASLDDPSIGDMSAPEAHERLVHDIALLDEAGHPFSHEAAAGALSPVFFASALTNFGVEPFLREFVELAPAPTARESSTGLVDPADPQFNGFVFRSRRTWIRSTAIVLHSSVCSAVSARVT
jgi:peptide chain release factor 3